MSSLDMALGPKTLPGHSDAFARVPLAQHKWEFRMLF